MVLPPQRSHDEAITSRTNLRLKVEEEEMQQELVELKLKRDHARAKLGGCVVMWGWSEEGGRVMVWGVVEEWIGQGGCAPPNSTLSAVISSDIAFLLSFYPAISIKSHLSLPPIRSAPPSHPSHLPLPPASPQFRQWSMRLS